MNVIGQIVAVLFSVGLIFLFVAIVRGRIDGAAAVAVALLFLALATTVWAAINRKRNRT